MSAAARKHAIGLPALAGAALLLLAVAQAAAQDIRRGEKIFEECRACHTMDPGSSNVGPSLFGVIGRKAGWVDDFRFSPAMRRSNLIWTRETLDAFIADPQSVVPANRMPYSGLANAKDRADLVAYITRAATATAQAPR